MTLRRGAKEKKSHCTIRVQVTQASWICPPGFSATVDELLLAQTTGKGNHQVSIWPSRLSRVGGIQISGAVLGLSSLPRVRTGGSGGAETGVLSNRGGARNTSLLEFGHDSLTRGCGAENLLFRPFSA